MESAEGTNQIRSRRQLREQEKLATTVRPEMPNLVAPRLDTGPIFTPPATESREKEQPVLRRRDVLRETSQVEPVIQIPVVKVPAEQVHVPTEIAQRPMSRRERRLMEESGLIQVVPEHLQTPAIETSVVTEVAPPEPVTMSEPVPEVVAESVAEPVAVTVTESESTPVPAPEVIPEQTPDPVVPTSQTTASSQPYTVPSNHWHNSEEIARRVEGDISVDKATLVMNESRIDTLSGPILTTGEILMTGSVEIPRSISTTGAIFPVDSSEIDLDIGEGSDEQTSDVLPVRASSAVGSRDGDLLKSKVPNKITFTSVLIALAVGAAAFALTYFVTAFFLGWLD